MTTEQEKSLRDAMMDIIFLMLNSNRWLKKEDVGYLTSFDENMTEYTDAWDSKNEHYFSGEISRGQTPQRFLKTAA